MNFAVAGEARIREVKEPGEAGEPGELQILLAISMNEKYKLVPTF